MATNSTAGVGPNPWKSVLVLEELGVDYKTEYLDFGSDKNGVEHPKFLQKNPAGRVPLLWDPKSGTATYSLSTESNH